MGRRFKKQHNKKGFANTSGPSKRACVGGTDVQTATGGAGAAKEETGRKGEWSDWILENEAFEKYYKAQKICPENEFDAMMESLRAPLPVAIRINKLAPAWQLTRRAVEQRFGMQMSNGKETAAKANSTGTVAGSADDKMSDTTGRTADKEVVLNEEAETDDAFKVECLKWFPDSLAWHWRSADRQKVKRNAAMKELKKFLVDEDMRGAISRQEAVSMIPPIVLDIKSHHLVLDMCAAPGSKTTEMMDIMTWGEDVPLHGSSSCGATATHTGMPRGGLLACTGAVVANDVSSARAAMLTHQVQRMGAPHVAITCIDACFFPALLQKVDSTLREVTVAAGGSSTGTDNEVVVRYQRKMRRQLLFDRILADVPCSGDGTLRKSPDIWRNWSPQNALLGLHGRQLTIAIRGMAHLAVGGKLLYSTCSLNPIENEAVVAAVLHRLRHCVRLEQCPNLGEHIVTHPGVSFWRVPRADDKTGTQFYDGIQSLEKDEIPKLRATVFPPSAEDAVDFHLERCMRLLPHANDSGGFFVALFTKFAPSRQTEAPHDATSTAPLPAPTIPPTTDNNDTCVASTECAADHQPNIAESATETATVIPTTTATAATAAATTTATSATAAAAATATSATAAAATAVDVHEAVEELTTNRGTAGTDSTRSSTRRERAGSVASKISHEYAFVDRSGDDWRDITQFYGLTSGTTTGTDMTTSTGTDSSNDNITPSSDLVGRTVHRVHTTRRLYVVSERLSQLLRNYEFACTLNWMHMGVRAFEILSAGTGDSDDNKYTCKWRIAQDGAAAVVPYMTRRLIIVSSDFVKRLGDCHSVQLKQLLDAEKEGEVRNLDSCRQRSTNKATVDSVSDDTVVSTDTTESLVSGGAVMICLEAVGMSDPEFWDTRDARDAPCIACLIGRNTLVPYMSKIPFASLCSLL